MYAQICTRPDIACVTGILDRYLSNLGADHWKLLNGSYNTYKRLYAHILEVGSA